MLPEALSCLIFLHEENFRLVVNVMKKTAIDREMDAGQSAQADNEALETVDPGNVMPEQLAELKDRAAKAEEHWVETCFCDAPLEEERPYWEKYFNLLSVKDAHSRRNCRHENGTEPWACCDCDCTKQLEEKLAQTGKSFLRELTTGTL